MQELEALEKVFEKLQEKGLKPRRVNPFNSEGTLIVAHACDLDKTPSFFVYRRNGRVFFKNHSVKCRGSLPEKGDLSSLLKALQISSNGFETTEYPLSTSPETLEYLKKRLQFDNDRELEEFLKEYKIVPLEDEIIFHHYSPEGEYLGDIRHLIDRNPKYLNPRNVRVTPYLLYESLHKGVNTTLFFITEGAFDALSVHRVKVAGVATLGVPNAKRAFKAVMKALKSRENPADFEAIVLAFDNDGGGKKATREVLEEFLTLDLDTMYPVIALKLPEDVKDLNELLQKFGPKDFLNYIVENLIDPRIAYGLSFVTGLFSEKQKIEALSHALSYHQRLLDTPQVNLINEIAKALWKTDDFVEISKRQLGITDNAVLEALSKTNQAMMEEQTLKDFRRDVIEIVNSSVTTQELIDRLHSALYIYEVRTYSNVERDVSEFDLERIYEELTQTWQFIEISFMPEIRFRPEDLILLKGETGRGKTTIALNIIADLLKRGYSVIHFPYEYDRANQLLEIARIIYGWNLEKLETLLNDKKAFVTELSLFKKEFGERLNIVYNASLSDIRNAVRAFSEKHGEPPTLIVVDYDMWVKVPGKFENTERRVDAISKGLKGIAVQYKTAVLLLSQVNKSGDAKWGNVKKEDASLVIDIKDWKSSEELPMAYQVTLVIEKTRNLRPGDQSERTLTISSSTRSVL